MSIRTFLIVFLVGVTCGYRVYPECHGERGLTQCGPFAFCEESFTGCTELCWEKLPRVQADWVGRFHELLVPRVDYTPIPRHSHWGVCINGIPTSHHNAFLYSNEHRTVARRTLVEYDDPTFTHLEAESFPELTDKPHHLKDQLLTNECVRRVFTEPRNHRDPPTSWYEPVPDGHKCGRDTGECFAWRCWETTSNPVYCAPDANLPAGLQSGLDTPPDCSGQPPSNARWA